MTIKINETAMKCTTLKTLLTNTESMSMIEFKAITIVLRMMQGGFKDHADIMRKCDKLRGSALYSDPCKLIKHFLKESK